MESTSCGPCLYRENVDRLLCPLMLGKVEFGTTPTIK